MNQNDQMRKHILDLYNAVCKACGDDTAVVKQTIKSQGGDYKAIKQALNHTPDTGEMVDHIGDANKMVQTAEPLTRGLTDREKAILFPPHPCDFGIPKEYWESSKYFAEYFAQNQAKAQPAPDVRELVEALEDMFQQFAKGPSTIKGIEARAKAKAALKSAKEHGL